MPNKRDDGLAGTSSRVRQRYGSPGDAGDAVFALLTGLRSGWSATEILTWFRERIVVTGWMRKYDPRSVTLEISEEGLGTVQVPLLGRLSPSEEATFATMWHAAAPRVIAVLRQLRDHPDDPRVTSEAIAAGRVKLVPIKGATESWGAVLREGEPFSRWLLTMLAADVLSAARDYTRLHVCDECDLVWFASGQDRLCATHRVR